LEEIEKEQGNIYPVIMRDLGDYKELTEQTLMTLIYNYEGNLFLLYVFQFRKTLRQYMKVRAASNFFHIPKNIYFSYIFLSIFDLCRKAVNAK